MADADGLDDAAEQILRVGLTAAARLAERLARARTQSQREAALRSDRDARDLTARVEAERRAAAAQLALTRDPRSMRTADSREAVGTAARGWALTDRAGARDGQRIRHQDHARHGPDAGSSGPDRTAEVGAGWKAGSPAERAARADAAVLLATPDVGTRVQTWLADHPGQLPGLSRAQTTEAVEAPPAR